MSKELAERLDKNKQRLAVLDRHLDIAAKRKQMEALRLESQAGDFWNDSQTAQKKMKELNHCKALIEKRDAYQKHLGDVEAVLDLLKEEKNEELEKEAGEKLTAAEQGLDELEFQRMKIARNHAPICGRFLVGVKPLYAEG